MLMYFDGFSMAVFPLSCYNIYVRGCGRTSKGVQEVMASVSLLNISKSVNILLKRKRFSYLSY